MHGVNFYLFWNGPPPDVLFSSMGYGASAVNSIRQQRAAAVPKRWVTRVEQSFDHYVHGCCATRPLKRL